MEGNFARCDLVHKEAVRAKNMMQLRRRMWAYYRSCDRNRGSMSAIGKLTMPMLTSIRQPRLKATAAESRHLVPLLDQLCREHPQLLAGHLTICSSELNRFYACMEAEPRRRQRAGCAHCNLPCLGSWLIGRRQGGTWCINSTSHGTWPSGQPGMGIPDSTGPMQTNRRTGSWVRLLNPCMGATRST